MTEPVGGIDPHQDTLTVGIVDAHGVEITHEPFDNTAVGYGAAIDEAMSAGKAVYVHCWGGVGRTGTVVGCWLVRHGRTGEQALEQIATWWTGMEKAYRIPRSPEMPRQLK